MSVNWFKYSSPQTFFPLAGKLAFWFGALAFLACAAGLYIGFFRAPTDAQQGEAYRIIFIHVPAAWMSMFLYVVMAFWAGLGLAFNTRLSGMMRSEEHTSELQSPCNLVCRLLLEKKKKIINYSRES